MERDYSYKDVKYDGKKGSGLFCKQNLDTLFYKQKRHMVAEPQSSKGRMVTLQAKDGEYNQKMETDHSSLQPFLKKSGSSHIGSNQNALYLEKQKRKRWLTSPIPNKKSHTLTLSESFVNLIMVDGKKGKAERIFSQTLKKLAEYLQDNVEGKHDKKKKITNFNRKENPTLLILSDKIEKRNVYQVLQKAIDNVKPTLQVRKVRIARSIYQVPFIMKKERQERNAARWIIEGAKKKK